MRYSETMNFKYFDIHSHLNLSPLAEKRAEVLAVMKEKNIGTITVGTGLETSRLAVEIARENPGVCWATIGVHPNDTAEEFPEEEFAKLAEDQSVVAIGECGLDYFRINNEELIIKNSQKELFKRHIELAIKVGKPLMIHARPSKGSMDAYEDALAILKTYPGTKANFHFFVGDIVIAKQIAELGWTMSFDGPITFARDYDEVIRSIPLTALMAETDAPYAAPEPYRGKECQPWMVEQVYNKIAEIRGEDAETVRQAINENLARVFGV